MNEFAKAIQRENLRWARIAYAQPGYTPRSLVNMKWTFEATKTGYLNMWSSARIKPGQDMDSATRFATKIIQNEGRYQNVARMIGCPWYLIGAIHMREASCNFSGVLHNGEKIIGTGRKTRLVPAGRGPFSSWEEAAIDALEIKNWHQMDWSRDLAARCLWVSEIFNGLGYVGKGTNSAYVWAGTNHEQPGKYVRDHVWDGGYDDPQIGTACVLLRLVQLRPDIDRELKGAVMAPPPPPAPPPPDTEKEPESLWAHLYRHFFGS